MKSNAYWVNELPVLVKLFTMFCSTLTFCKVAFRKGVGERSVGGTPDNGPLLATHTFELSKKLKRA